MYQQLSLKSGKSWHRQKLADYFVDNKKSVLIGLAFTLIVFGLRLFTGQPFEWTDFELIEKPHWGNPIYSSLTFLTTGATLYALKFYEWLYSLFRPFKAYEVYQTVKAAIWLGLTTITFFITSILIDFLNFIISLTLNTGALLLYFTPAIMVFLVTVLAIFIINRFSQNDLRDTKHRV